MNIDREQTSFNIANEIKKSGYTLDQLSKESGISTITIYKWIKGDKVPSLNSLIKISNVLKVKIDNFFSLKF